MADGYPSVTKSMDCQCLELSGLFDSLFILVAQITNYPRYLGLLSDRAVLPTLLVYSYGLAKLVFFFIFLMDGLAGRVVDWVP